MGVKLIKISVIYFAIGVLFGLYMSMAKNYSFTGVHVHVNLLGWSSLSMAGILYLMFPKIANGNLGKIHFWFHNIGLPLMMIGLYLVICGYSQFVVMISIGAVMVVIGVLVFTYNVLKNIHMSDYRS